MIYFLRRILSFLATQSIRRADSSARSLRDLHHAKCRKRRKYIFLKDGKLLLSVNGLSTYSTWQMATESSIIMDEGVATFLYKVVHIDDNVVVLNLDGTENFCFLINDSSESLAKASLEDIQWYLYRNCNIDILSPEQKSKREYEAVRYGNDLRIQQEKDDDQDVFYFIVVIVVVVVVLFLLIIYCVNVNN